MHDLYHKCCLSQAVTPTTVRVGDDGGSDDDDDDTSCIDDGDGR